ncbi:hypothetical protein DPMN_113507 [Dreissena polymorpha]|uniref:Uncharacterized protein n=1 Tax=Dreissena polymorpha TaxID=45954 RepID=A0A9D4KHK1_DREPO|nr:hypothetical protein DPMN_113507 [Dreissena polymorpha]
MIKVFSQANASPPWRRYSFSNPADMQPRNAKRGLIPNAARVSPDQPSQPARTMSAIKSLKVS